MNSSSFIEPSVLVQNSTMTIAESWFIPLDIFMVLCCSLLIILSIFVLSIMILDKTFHTAPMMLIANSSLAAFTVASSLFGVTIFTFQNDLKQIQYQDLFCVFRVYSCYITGTAYFNSYLLQALYRYLIVIYPTRLFLQSFRFQILIICSSWLLSFVYPFSARMDGQIVYNVDNKICTLPFSFSFSIIYMTFFMYLCPVSLIMFIYLKLIRHVREIGKNMTGTNTLIRAKRELKAIQRIVILITFVVIVLFPYAIIMLMGFFNHAPKYKFRISFALIEVSLLATAIILFQFTDPLKETDEKNQKATKSNCPNNDINGSNV